MKKTILSLALVAMGMAAYAQKPEAGALTTEIGLTSLLGAPANPSTLNLNNDPAGGPLGMFRVRYFLSPGMAIRANLTFGMNTNKDVVDDDGLPTVADKSERTAKGTTFGVALGIEKHLAGTAKLSPYFGAELGFKSQSGTTEITNYKGAVGGGGNFEKGSKMENTGGARSTFALNALFGADYYIVENVYFGAELGLGLFASSKTAEGETKYTDGGADGNGIDNSATGKVYETTSTGFGLTPNAMGVIRLGIILK